MLPRFAGYGQAWAVVAALGPGPLALLVAVAAVNVLSYAPLWMAALPGLGFWRAAMVDQVSTALTNTVPAGFTLGAGADAAMFHSFGFSMGAATRAIAASGLWNNLGKLAMPALALPALAVTRQAPRALVTASLVGGVVLLLAVGLLVALLAHAGAAAAMSGAAERLAGRAARLIRRPAPTGWTARTDHYRRAALDLLRHRWPALTAAALGYHGALFVMFLATVRLVDEQAAGIGWPALYAVFSVTRLLTLVPITPGALGLAELSYVAGLTALGLDPAGAAGSVLLFRFLSWFPPIPLGVAGWLLWRAGVGTRPTG